MRSVRYITKRGNVTESFAVAKAEGIEETFLLEVNEVPENIKLQMKKHALKAEQKRREKK